MGNDPLLRARFRRMTKRRGGHLLWQGRLASGGGGQMWVDGHRVPARWVALRLAGVDVPPGRVVKCTCDEQRCVKVEHLQVLTRAHAATLRRRPG
jgi:hypothetical protein